MMSTFTQGSDALGVHVLSVALIGPEEQRRRAVANAIAGSQAKVTREFVAYPELDDVPQVLESGYEVIIVDLDSDPEHALELVENICGSSSATVMVYSAQTDPEMLVRCMRAGAREFLTQPIAPATIAEALVRASVRRPAVRTVKEGMRQANGLRRRQGRLRSQHDRQQLRHTRSLRSRTRIPYCSISDFRLEPPRLTLDITTEFSTANALQNISRLDSNFLSKLLVKHSSGLSVLAAPDRYTPIQASNESLAKLISVARQDFDYVVVDAGSSVGPTYKTLISGATIAYLVTQVGISELRNSNRIISEFFTLPTPKLEIVLNRFTQNPLGIDEENITKALTRPANWKIPSDYGTVQRAQNTATPLALGESAITAVIRQMARTACGLPAVAEKKKRFQFIRLK